MAESYCERVLSCADDVSVDGNTLLSDDEIEKLVVLRMNRSWMRAMRVKFKHELKETFGRTVLPEGNEGVLV